MRDSGLDSCLSHRQHRNGLLLILAVGAAICVWDLGSTGLVDETPPLFAAAGRAMRDTGDWLTPRVNGLPRYDKPPLLYWLMALFYSLPGHSFWDPLGTWAARLPSALSSVLMMLVMADTLMRWPQNHDPYPRRTAIGTALAFALSPIVLVWTRIAVSDALLCCTFGLSMIFHWRCYVNPSTNQWWLGWFFLGLAVLTKGPVAIALAAISLIAFSLLHGDSASFWRCIKPRLGIFITCLISLPWYLLELIFEGKPFWDSFFGYHNFQRFASVVNSHSQPWWFFFLMLIVASLPFTPFLILGLIRSFEDLMSNFFVGYAPSPKNSMPLFATCWLLTILLFFTLAATKLPSYWLPATPAAAFLIGPSASYSIRKDFLKPTASLLMILILFFVALVLWGSQIWIWNIHDPEMPTLVNDLYVSGLINRAAFFFAIAGLIGFVYVLFFRPLLLLAVQVPLIFFQLFSFLPLWRLGDDLRQLPLRQVSELIINFKTKSEPVLMVGAMKPSLHFYSRQIIIQEGRTKEALVNLEDRLRNETRQGFEEGYPKGFKGLKTAIVVIDQQTIKRNHWARISFDLLGKRGIYFVGRINLKDLENQANRLKKQNIVPNWDNPRPERF
ncbi:glycosyltransferase family 39 protein [Prochlorococcus sp. MIT 1300]|uniref:ArnT family glycosyltransferase n=1 Tax=Prochlorococcus sp. MIT 1300 TaxID=3096218 RepID=UPI002A7503AE|nr:glycosyltransferase family 39 protein [Prochlorococcus sp. MIT 1300]